LCNGPLDFRREHPGRIGDIFDALYRQESRRVFSTLARLLGSFDLAEDALHDAFELSWAQKSTPS
jgi:RNA polymerase sigma-70 factor, ECF subfamily